MPETNYCGSQKNKSSDITHYQLHPKKDNILDAILYEIGAPPSQVYAFGGKICRPQGL
ncbi:MAG: hypothetical protein H6Q22_1613 [Bacteroidetes bacterium]|nr:hypothetical protein [Bacteroidota bacterium]